MLKGSDMAKLTGIHLTHKHNAGQSAGVVMCCFTMSVTAEVTSVIRSLEANPLIYLSVRSVFLQFEVNKNSRAELW